VSQAAPSSATRELCTNVKYDQNSQKITQHCPKNYQKLHKITEKDQKLPKIAQKTNNYTKITHT
jgi:hypothetical protein